MLRHVLAVTFVASAITAQAQIAHADFNTFTFNTNVSMGGPGLLLAIKTTIPQTFVASRIDIWTGEGVGTNTIALWSHDPVGNRPAAPLGSGSWSMGWTNGWQGAPLTTPVQLQIGQEVWVVWGCINGSQSSVQGTGAGAQQYRGSFDGGASWNGPFQSNQWKFRIWSGPAGHATSYGTGCQGGAGVPRLGWFGVPMAGAGFDVTLERALPSTAALLVLGDSDTTWSGVPLPFSLAPLGAPNCSLRTSLVASLTSGVDVTGQAVMNLVMPPNPALAGFPFFAQWACLDLAANAFGFTFSNAVAATVGA